MKAAAAAAAAATVPAVVTAGGRLSGALAQKTGETVKALAPVGGRPLIDFILGALAQTPGIGPIVVVGPVQELSGAPSLAEDVTLIEEGATGPENIRRGLEAAETEAGDGMVLLCTSDMPYIDAEAIAWLLENAPQDADIVYPVITREAYLAAFPNSPNTFAPLAGRWYTGGSVLLVRPAAIRENLPLIEQVFNARKSQVAMARLLGLPFILRFVTGQLTIPQVETRASLLTGCRCRALLDAPPKLAADIDTLGDYEYALTRCGSGEAAAAETPSLSSLSPSPDPTSEAALR